MSCSLPAYENKILLRGFPVILFLIIRRPDLNPVRDPGNITIRKLRRIFGHGHEPLLSVNSSQQPSVIYGLHKAGIAFVGIAPRICCRIMTPAKRTILLQYRHNITGKREIYRIAIHAGSYRCDLIRLFVGAGVKNDQDAYKQKADALKGTIFHIGRNV